jgi:hypothetical protein
MPSRVWSHICDYAAIDANGKAMIIGEFSGINAKSAPVQHPLFFVVIKWAGVDQETFIHRVRITDPNRNTIVESPPENVTIRGGEKGEGGHISIHAFMMTVFKKFGEYSVEILLDDLPVHIMPLFIRQRP